MVKKLFFRKSNNRLPLMALKLKLTYMWNIVAKLAKLRKSIFSRVTPTIINELAKKLYTKKKLEQ